MRTSQSQKPHMDEISEFTMTSNPSEFDESDQRQTVASESSTNYFFIVSFIILGFYFLVFAVIELTTNFNEISYTFPLVRQSDTEYSSEVKFISFHENDLISIYLGIPGLTQMDVSLRNPKASLKDCPQGFQTNGDLNKTVNFDNVTALLPSISAVPCGQYLSYYPEGSFEITNSETSDQLPISTENIVFTDFELENDYPSYQWADMTTQRFKVWVLRQPQVSLEKHWGTIQQSTAISGKYKITLKTNNYIPANFGEIEVTLQNNASLGGYNLQLCLIYFLFGIFTFLGSLASFLIQKKWGFKKILKRKEVFGHHSSEFKLYLNSRGNTTPASKIE